MLVYGPRLSSKAPLVLARYIRGDDTKVNFTDKDVYNVDSWPWELDGSIHFHLVCMIFCSRQTTLCRL